MSILFLPLDSRPCTYDLPYEIGMTGGLNVIRPLLSLMDNYRIPSDHNKISKWLIDNVDKCEYGIISIDQLVYGSLISSRNLNVDLDICKKRLEVLKELKRLNPNIKLYCTNTIMRTTISTLKKEDEIYWEKVGEFSKASSSNPELAEKIRKEIPEEIINNFLNSRIRNHAINKEMLNYLYEGIIEKIVFLQEDSAPEGMHKKEQAIIINKAKELNIIDNVILMNGTDEIASTLMGYIINPNEKYVYLHSNNKLDSFTALFEDRPFKENLDKYLNLCNIKQKNYEDTNIVLSIYLPKDKQGDYCGKYLSEKDDPKALDNYVRNIKEFIDDNKKVYLLDLYDANGGNLELIKKLYEYNILDRLSAYSGWNTASNSLGSLLGELCLNNDNKKLLYYHLLDDVFYQSVVRDKLQTYLNNKGIDNWNLDDSYNETNILLNEYMHEEVNKIDINKTFVKFVAELRWPRTFECHIDIK